MLRDWAITYTCSLIHNHKAVNLIQGAHSVIGRLYRVYSPLHDWATTFQFPQHNTSRDFVVCDVSLLHELTLRLCDTLINCLSEVILQTFCLAHCEAAISRSAVDLSAWWERCSQYHERLATTYQWLHGKLINTCKRTSPCLLLAETVFSARGEILIWDCCGK